MIDKEFFKQYASKIKNFSSSDNNNELDWEQMVSMLNQRALYRKRRVFIYLMVFVLVFTMVGWFAYNENAKIQINNQNENPWAEQAITFAKISTQTSKIASSGQSQLQPKIDILKDGISKKIVFIHQTKGNTSDYSEKVSITNTISEPISLCNKKDVLAQEDIMTINSIFSNNKLHNGDFEKEILVTDDIKSHVDVDMLDLLPSLYSNKYIVSHNLNSFAPEIENNILLPIPERNIPCYFKVDGGLIHSFLHNTAAIPVGTLVFPTHNTVANSGFQIGFTFQILKENKWKFGVGITRTQLMQYISHNATLNLSDGICLNPNSNDLKEYAFTYNVTNGRSTSTINLRLMQENPDNPIDSSESFMINMDMQKQMTRWLIPITMERKIFEKNKCKLFTKVGLHVGYVSNLKEQIIHFSEACTDFCFNHGLRPTINTQKPNLVSSGLILGTSLEWQFIPKMSVVFNPEINTNFLIGKTSGNPTNLLLNVGLQYQINQ